MLQYSTPADTITWRLVVTSLLTVLGVLIRSWFLNFLKEQRRTEHKINGIIRFLIKTAANGERDDLIKLIGGEGDDRTTKR